MTPRTKSTTPTTVDQRGHRRLLVSRRASRSARALARGPRRPRRGRRRRTAALIRGYVVVGQHRSDCVDDAQEAAAAVAERLHAHLVGRVVDGRSDPAAAARPRARAGPPGTPRRPPARTPRLLAVVQSTAGATSGTRSGQPSASAIGSRMSGGEACAMVEPSTNSTIEWTIDCGCTTTSIRSKREPEQQVRLDHLETLVDQGRGVDRDHRAHVPGRVGQRLLGSHVGEVSHGSGRGTGHRSPSGRAGAPRRPPAAQALGQRRVLGVDRHDLPGLGGEVTSGRR